MTRALDHLVLATRDLPRMVSSFAALGFKVGARNRHPWGTENHIIQFHSTFLEIVGLGDGYRPLAETDQAYPFAGFIERYLERHGSGLAMAVLRATDAEADAVRFARIGLGDGSLLPFSRSARGPNGSDRTVAFTLAFASAQSMPEIGFFTCEQRRPENFWNPLLQDHPNGAEEMTGFDIVAEEPDAPARFLAAFADQDAGVPIENGIAVDLEGGRITVTSSPKDKPPAGVAARIDAVTVRLRDLRAVRDRIDEAAGWTAMPAEPGRASRVVASEAGFGLRMDSSSSGPHSIACRP